MGHNQPPIPALDAAGIRRRRIGALRDLLDEITVRHLAATTQAEALRYSLMMIERETAAERCP